MKIKKLVLTPLLMVVSGGLIFGGPIVNVAASANGGVASQSSTYVGGGNFGPNYAIDGINPNNYLSTRNLQHTLLENGAWWEVVFNDEYYITDAEVFNRIDCCQDRINNFFVTLYDSMDGAVWSSMDNSIILPATSLKWMGINQWGKRFRVQLHGENWLHMEEVVVNADLGRVKDPGPGPDPGMVPEPASTVLMAAGLAGVVFARRRMRKA